MLKIRRPLGRLIFNMGIAIPGKTVFLIETPPGYLHCTVNLLMLVCYYRRAPWKLYILTTNNAPCEDCLWHIAVFLTKLSNTAEAFAITQIYHLKMGANIIMMIRNPPILLEVLDRGKYNTQKMYERLSNIWRIHYHSLLIELLCNKYHGWYFADSTATHA